MYEKPYYYDPFANNSPQGTATPPGEGAYRQSTGVNGSPGSQYTTNGSAYYQPQPNQYTAGNTYAPRSNYGYYGTNPGGYQPPSYAYPPYGNPQAPVLDEKAMAEINKANAERRELSKKGNTAGCIVLLMLLFSMAFTMLPELLGIRDAYGSNALVQNGMYVFYSIFCVGGAAFLATYKMRKNSRHIILPVKKLSAGHTAIYVLVGFACCLLANMATSVVLRFFSLFGIQMREVSEPPVTSVFGLFIAIMAMAVIPAVVEECSFRGALMQPLRSHGDKTAILLSAIVFGAFHGNLQQIPFAFMVGLVLGFVTVKTGSIVPAMLIHFINNGNSVLVGYLYDTAGDQAANRYFYILMGVVLIASAVLVILTYLRGRGNLFRLDRVQNDRIGNPYQLTTGKKVKAFLTAPCMVLSLCLLLVQTVLMLQVTW